MTVRETTADVIYSFLVLVVIFAIIFALSGNWSTFVLLSLTGSLLIFFSNLLRRSPY